jgi:hypothetical protein
MKQPDGLGQGHFWGQGLEVRGHDVGRGHIHALPLAFGIFLYAKSL